jgi:hypothetical protein
MARDFGKKGGLRSEGRMDLTRNHSTEGVFGASAGIEALFEVWQALMKFPTDLG